MYGIYDKVKCLRKVETFEEALEYVASYVYVHEWRDCDIVELDEIKPKKLIGGAMLARMTQLYLSKEGYKTLLGLREKEVEKLHIDLMKYVNEACDNDEDKCDCCRCNE